jgi:DNA polymerase III subunit epsilon
MSLEAWDKPLAELPLVVLDTEATGLYPGLGHRLTEVAAVRYEGWQAVGQVHEIVYPERPIGAQASGVSGLRDEDVAGRKLFVEVGEELLALLEGAVLVAHNAQFDANLLGLEFYLGEKLHGRVPPPLAPLSPRQPILPNPWLCTLLLARRFFTFDKNTLSHVAHKLNVPVGRAHRALNDVHLNAEVLKRMMRELGNQQNLNTAADLLHAQGAPIYSNPAPAVPLPPPLAELVDSAATVELLYLEGQKRVRLQTRLLYAIEHRGEAHLITQSAPGVEPLAVPWGMVLGVRA